MTIKTDVAARPTTTCSSASGLPRRAPRKTYLRDYPQRTVGAQLYGTLAEISPEQLKEKRYRGVEAGTRIGSGGIEETYDRWLRGVDGFTRVSIDAQGTATSCRRHAQEPRQGQRVQLSLDLELQRAADNAMQRAIAAAPQVTQRQGGRVRRHEPGQRRDLRARLLPELRRQHVRQADLAGALRPAQLRGQRCAAVQPRDRGDVSHGLGVQADHGDRGLESGTITPGRPSSTTAKFELGGREFHNARTPASAPCTCRRRSRSPRDVFFDLGLKLNGAGPVLQSWARRLGLARRTGIDLPGEPGGLVPDRGGATRASPSTCAAQAAGSTPVTTAALFACGGIERPWSAGDNVYLAVGQGDLQATPLQVAVAYSALANGGKRRAPAPRQARRGRQRPLVQEIRPGPPARGDRPADRAVIMEGLRGAATGPAARRPTSSRASRRDGLRQDRYCRARDPARPVVVRRLRDQQNRPIVVVTTIEKGGFGAETAAPAACLHPRQVVRCAATARAGAGDATSR